MVFFDPDGRKGRTYAKGLVSTHGTHTELVRLLGRLLLLPIWLPILIWRRRKLKREQISFAQASVRKGVTSTDEMALEWVMSHPKEYRYGEYDPALPQVRLTFERVLESLGVMRG